MLNLIQFTLFLIETDEGLEFKWFEVIKNGFFLFQFF